MDIFQEPIYFSQGLGRKRAWVQFDRPFLHRLISKIGERVTVEYQEKGGLWKERRRVIIVYHVLYEA